MKFSGYFVQEVKIICAWSGGSSGQVTLLGFRGVMATIQKLSSDSNFHEFEFLSVFYSPLEA